MYATRLTCITGKQARVAEDQSRKNETAPQQAAQPVHHHSAPEGHQAPAQADPYSEAPIEGHGKSTKPKRVDDANLAKIVAEENASKSKFPRYPGLERWELVAKMGDGAFSNVYRARDTTGDRGEVAIKVVRKYEMNSMQVSLFGPLC